MVGQLESKVTEWLSAAAEEQRNLTAYVKDMMEKQQRGTSFKSPFVIGQLIIRQASSKVKSGSGSLLQILPTILRRQGNADNQVHLNGSLRTVSYKNSSNIRPKYLRH